MYRHIVGSVFRGGNLGRRRGWRVRAWLVASVSLFVVVGTARGQQAAVGGIVYAEGSLGPIGDAEVQVAGTDLRARTDASGRFRIDGVSGAQVTLEIRRIGFRAPTVTVRVGDLDPRWLSPCRIFVGL